MKRIVTMILALVLLLTLVPFQALEVHAAADYKGSDQLLEIVKKWEGFSAKPYWDYHQWTVGYGTRVPDGKLAEYTANGITEAEATQLLRDMMVLMEKELNSFIDKFGLTLTQGQFDALVSITFNCGPAWLTKVSEFRTAVIEGYTGNDFIFAIAQWSTAGGSTLPALVRRRLCEANMYLNGVYDSVPPANYTYVRYNANGGDSEIITQGYDLNTPAAIRAVPTYAGYQFEGWYTSATGGEKVEILDEGVRNYTLYAHWSAGDGEDLPQDTTDQTIVGTPVNYTVEVATGVLNSFENPIKGALVVDAYCNSDLLDIVAEYTDANGRKWGKIAGKGGWVNLEFTCEPTVDDESNGVEVEVTGSDVNLRRGPGTSYALVGKLQRGAKLIITRTQTRDGYTWGKSSKGWIALKYTNYDAVINGTEDGSTGSTPDTEAPTGPLFTGTVQVSDGLRIRSDAGTGYPVLGYLSNGAKVEILEKKTAGGIEWGRIDKGWISLEYVKADSDNTQTPDEKPAEKLTGTVHITSGTLNVRSGPSTGYGVVILLQKGAKVEILEQKTVGATVWGRIDKGWVSMDYILLDKPSVEEPAEPSEPTTPPATEPEPTDPEPTDPEPTEPEASEPTLPPEEKPVTGKIVLSSGTLNVRAGAGTSYAVVAYLGAGAKVEILEQKTVGATVWGRISKGWISMDYVQLDKDEDSKPATVTGTVTADGTTLRIRKGPGTSYAIAGYLAKGTKVEILEQKAVGSTVWGRIDKGWISLDYVKLEGNDSGANNDFVAINGTITADCLRVRSGAGTSNAIVGLLYYGAKVTILETKVVAGVTWGRTQQGWISMEYVK